MSRLFYAIFIYHYVSVVAKTPTLSKDRQPGSSGSDVVQAVLRDLENACIFYDDKLFLRRLAYVESKDGNADKTYRANYHGGIWQVDESRFHMTRMSGPPLDGLRQNIQHKLAIDWSKVQWSDLHKPLYSGLAAVMYFELMTNGNSDLVPEGLDQQGQYWKATYRQTNKSQEFVNSAKEMEKGCRTEDKIDLLFILESSSRLTTMDFDKVKNFTKNVVNTLNIGPDHVRVAVERYSSNTKVEFGFDIHPDNVSLLEAIDNITYVPGSMDTAKALKLAKDHLFLQNNKSRAEASKVIVLISSGQTDSVLDTMSVVVELHKLSVTIYTVSVGQNVNEKVFQLIASLPPCSHTFKVMDYDHLSKFKLPLVHPQCTVPIILQPGEYSYQCGFNVILQASGGSVGSTMTISLDKGKAAAYVSYSSSFPDTLNQRQNLSSSIPTRIPVPANKTGSVFIRTETSHNFACSGNYKVVVETSVANNSVCPKEKMDIVILLDAGVSKTQKEFKKMMDFASTFVSQFDIGPKSTHFSVVNFAENATNQFWLTDYVTKGQILNAFHHIQPYGQNVNLAAALAFAREHSFTPRHGMRDDAEKVILLITDNILSPSAAIHKEAQLLHNDGVRIVVTTIGTRLDRKILDMLTSWHHHVEHVSKFDDLDKVVENVTEAACAKVELVCEELGFQRNCSIEDLVRLIHLKFGSALVPGHGYLASNPCNISSIFPGVPQITRFPHPTDTDKFILCEHQQPLIVLCPPNEIYNTAKQTCVITQSLTTAPGHVTGSPVFYTGSTAHHSSIGEKFCSVSNLNKNSLIHPYPGDHHKYIRCTGIPGWIQVLSCGFNKIFLEHFGRCGNEYVLLENGQFDKTQANPCTKAGQIFPHLSDPSKFIECDTDGNAHVKKCQPPKIYNNFLHACDY